jgi:RNA-binding protein 23/39
MSTPAKQIFIGDISNFCTIDDLKELFIPFGNVVDVDIKKNGKTGKPLSYGFVTFDEVETATETIKVLDGTYFFGRKLR